MLKKFLDYDSDTLAHLFRDAFYKLFMFNNLYPSLIWLCGPREMALAGLNLLHDARQSSAGSADFKYPDVTEMLNYICHQRPQLLCSDDQTNGKMLFASKTFLSMIKFLMKCFESSDSPDLVQDDPSHSPVAKMCIILENAMSYEGSSELHALALKSLVDLYSREPKVSA